MPKASDVLVYVTPDDIAKHGKKATITGPGTLRSKEESRFGKATIELPIRFPDGYERLWTPNTSTIRKLAPKWGDDTAEWVNKDVALRTAIMLIRGEEREVILGDVYVEQAEPATTTGRRRTA